MPTMALELTIGDYTQWRNTFDSGKSLRTAAQVGNERVFRNADDPTKVLVLMDAADAEKARQTVSSPEVKAKMQEGGVVGAPRLHVLG